MLAKRGFRAVFAILAASLVSPVTSFAPATPMVGANKGEKYVHRAFAAGFKRITSQMQAVALGAPAVVTAMMLMLQPLLF
jgi:hypothetical protein